MWLRIGIVLFLLAEANVLASQAGNYRFINYGTKDGLNDKVVYNAAQDKKGYMWFGTATGLYRYDGHRFTYHRSPLDKAGSSIGNVLQAIRCDNSGNLWLGSLTTLQWYNPQKNIFWQPDMNNELNKKMAASYFFNFSEGKYTWCSTSKNFVYRFNKKDSSFLSLAPGYPPGASTTSFSTVEDGGLLFDIHPEGLYIFNLDGRFVKMIPHPPGDITNGNYAPNEKAIYLTTYVNGLLRFDLSTQTITRIESDNINLKKNFLYSAEKDDGGNMLIGATSLFISNPAKNIFLDFYSGGQKNEFSFRGSKIVNIFTDREKNHWFCSHNGLSMLPWQNNQVKTIMLTDETTGFVTEAIGAYEEPGTKNYLLINTSSRGLQHLDGYSGKVTTIVNHTEPDLYKKNIIGLIIAPDNAVYASDNNHFFKYDPVKKTLSPFLLKDREGKPIGPISRSTADKKGNIYIGSPDNGFYVWNYPAGGLFHFNKRDIIKTDTAGKDNNMVPCITDGKGNIWFTTSNGIYQYKPHENKYYHHFPPDGSDIPAMGESRYIAEDRRGHIWITTNNNGLYELFWENGKENWMNYNVHSGIGFPTDYFSKIKQSPTDSSLWMNNTAGLMKFDPVNKKVLSIFSMQNGLYEEGFGYTFNIFPDNRMVQLFYGAANIIDFNTYKWNTRKPEVQLNAVKVMDREKLFELDSKDRLLTLSSNQNFLQLEYSSLVYNNSNKSQYAYMLAGLDKDWVYSGQVNTVSYSGLKPGSYTFKVKAANNDGLWGDETILKIVIRKPFYARWWFIAWCGLLVGAAVYGWNRFKVSQAQKEEKLKAAFQQQIAETEMKALRAQMNPHFIFNSLNSIQKYILKNEHFEASQYLTKFSRLIRLILDHSNQNSISLSSEIEMLKLYVEMESLRFDNKFDYKIITDENLQPDMVEIPSMLVQPYVENAIWHGLLHKETKGTLLLSFTKGEKNNLVVAIEDDGIGRQKAAELKSKQVLKKKSYGMQITEDRIAIINRVQHINATSAITDLEDENGNARGTKVELNIPLKPLTV
jgi:ligand-binding sensor domain-containing protein/two-component sensor histidine kinase